MVTVMSEGVVPTWDEIAAVIAAQPGAVWIVGNEPDVIWQSNMTADRYAELYYEVYQFIKSHDPQAQVAVAGVAQPTPLRLAYLAAYIVQAPSQQKQTLLAEEHALAFLKGLLTLYPRELVLLKTIVATESSENPPQFFLN